MSVERERGVGQREGSEGDDTRRLQLGESLKVIWRTLRRRASGVRVLGGEWEDEGCWMLDDEDDAGQKTR